MKYSIALLILLLFGPWATAQKSLPIVHATSDETYFIEGKKGEPSEWWLDPSLALDVYETDKVVKSKKITFRTDQESFTIKLKPGEHYDFIVLLNEKDTCRTRILAEAPNLAYQNLSPATHDTIPFTVTSGNNLKVKAVLNQTDTVDLYFDSGATSITMTHEAIEAQSTLLSQEAEGYTLSTYTPLTKRHSLKLGNTEWDNLTIFPARNVGQETGGHFGWGLFRDRVVEIDYDHQRFIIHSSLPEVPKGYTHLPIEYINTLFCVQGKLVANGKKYDSRMLFDTGYQRGILLDSVLMRKQGFPLDLPAIKTTTLRNGAGTVFVTKIVNLDALKLGKAEATDVPTQLLDRANPARFETHILGNELLMRFNTFLDFQGNRVYLRPNQQMGLAYTDAK